jgi:hypothetical protein
MLSQVEGLIRDGEQPDRPIAQVFTEIDGKIRLAKGDTFYRCQRRKQHDDVDHSPD